METHNPERGKQTFLMMKSLQVTICTVWTAWEPCRHRATRAARTPCCQMALGVLEERSSKAKASITSTISHLILSRTMRDPMLRLEGAV